MSLLSKTSFVCLAYRQLVGKLDVPGNSLFLTSVRWRKRRWHPKTLTKTYYVREPTPIVPEEEEELRTRYNNYRTTMRTIRKFILDRDVTEKQERTSQTMYEQKAKEIELLMEENKQWNDECARLRATREAMEAKRKEEEMLKAMIDLEQKERQRKDRANLLIQQEMEAAKDFVTEDSLEEKIESALDNTLNYNFVLDSKGNTFVEQADGTLVELVQETGQEAGETPRENSAQAQ